MKRTPLKRKARLQARKPMKRTATRRKSPTRKASTESRWRSPTYLAWVRTMACCRCGLPGGDAHHVIGLHWGLSGEGLTAPDNFAMGVCRECHQAIHQSPELQRWQPNWLRWTIAWGVREFDGEIKERLMRAWDFIDEKEAA